MENRKVHQNCTCVNVLYTISPVTGQCVPHIDITRAARQGIFRNTCFYISPRHQQHPNQCSSGQAALAPHLCCLLTFTHALQRERERDVLWYNIPPDCDATSPFFLFRPTALSYKLVNSPDCCSVTRCRVGFFDRLRD